MTFASTLGAMSVFSATLSLVTRWIAHRRDAESAEVPQTETHPRSHDASNESKRCFDN
jgi:hypothetical protein